VNGRGSYRCTEQWIKRRRIEDGGLQLFCKPINGHDSATVFLITTKFGMKTLIGLLYSMDHYSYTFIFAVLLPVLSRLLIMSINTTLLIFQDGGRPPPWIFKSSKFQLLVPFGGPICVIRPNAVQISQTVAKISWFLDFQDVRRRHLDVLNFKFVTVQTVKRVWTASPCQISLTSLKPRPRYGNFSIFQNGGRRHLGLLKLHISNCGTHYKCRITSSC